MDKRDTVTQTSPRRRTKPNSLSEPRLCPAIGFSRIAGGKYKLRILWALNKRPHRSGEIRRSLQKGILGQPVTPRVLSPKLKELQRRGLIARRQFNVVPPKVEYSLTDRGRTLVPVLNAIVKWGMTRIHEEILADEIPADDRTASRAPKSIMGADRARRPPTSHV